METSDDWKCTEEKFCSGLGERLGHRGLVQGSFLNMKTGQPFWGPPMFQKDKKDRGLILNFCPWCGFSMQGRIDRIENRGKGTE